MIFQSLASSSHGNAYLVSDGETRILLECGLPYKRLQLLSGFCTTEFAGCLVSHEHKDHSYCARDLIRNGLPVYMSGGTAFSLLKEGRISVSDVDAARQMEAGVQFSVGTFDIVPFATYHDAAEPLGFLLRSRSDGEVLAFATDTCNLGYRFPGLTILAIEANYDAQILARCEKMPEKVRHRITNCHMEIDTLCRYLQGLDLSQCREIWLLHLSDATSHEGHFINKVCRAVPPGIRVEACPRGR